MVNDVECFVVTKLDDLYSLSNIKQMGICYMNINYFEN